MRRTLKLAMSPAYQLINASYNVSANAEKIDFMHLHIYTFRRDGPDHQTKNARSIPLLMTNRNWL